MAIAGRDLERLDKAFADLGLAPVYGGVHSNGATHMSLLAFDDGSYLELISTLNPDVQAPLWSKHIEHDAGPAGWAVEVEDVEAEARRARGLGIPVEGPTYYHRRRPDGELVEWDMAFLGGGEPGQTLPFVIRDRTPRRYRVEPSPSVAGTELAGIACVVIGVERHDPIASRLQALFGWQAPIVERHPALGASVASFPDGVAALASPAGPKTWLVERLALLGESPCAILLRTNDFRATAGRLPVGATFSWFGRRAAWIDSSELRGIRLGIVS